MPGPSADLLALVRPAEVAVTVAGCSFALGATTAARWLGALGMDPESLHGVMPGLIDDEDLEQMHQLALSHPDIEQRWTNAARVAVGRAAGRDWWWAVNLSRKALGSWSYINGILLRQNVNPRLFSYADWLDACYSLLWQGAKEEDQKKLDMELALRPRGVAVRGSRRATEQMMADFAAD